MEQTLGKRIVAQRKRLGLTQDQLAERLGVTAQAVSKWENDQSCPDISMLPKLAEIFGMSTDELLGMEPKTVHEAELVREAEEPRENDGIHVQNGTWEVRWDSGRKNGLGFGLWILLAGGLLLASNLLKWDADLWDILWPSGLLIFGLFGLFPKFSFFRLGCAAFGGYFLLSNLNVLPFALGKELLLPVLLVLFGLSLLIDALRKPKKGSFHVARDGKTVVKSSRSYCNLGEDSFECGTSFGENRRDICLPRLACGSADVSFGQLTVNLTGCGEIANGCKLDLNCSFGELELIVPRACRVESAASTAFASVEVKGNPDPGAPTTVFADCNVSFGEITVRYI